MPALIDHPTPEAAYIGATPLAHRKQFGQFFTPAPVAQVLARWVAGAPGLHHVLDPAVGTGLLGRAVRALVPGCHLTGYDVDPRILAWARDATEEPGAATTLHGTDFLTHDWQARYDGVIANPPYLKFHDYDNLPAIRHVEQQAGVKLTGFTNLYALFLIKALHQLRPDGRAAFVVPSEFLNADYGVAVKRYLLAHGMLRHVVVVDFQGSVFADALTTACLLLFGPAGADAGVAFSMLSSVEALAGWTPDAAPTPRPAAGLDSGVKWRRYYQQLAAVPATARYGPLVAFATVGKVSRGIATGANDYFVFTKAKARQWHLDPARSLRPCIARATDVPGSFFTAADFERLRAADRPVYLLDAGPAPEAAALAYFAEGEKQGVPARHLPASRRTWHRPENRRPAPIWVTVFNRGGLRFVRNETQTLNLTTFHSVYLNLFFQDRADLVMAYLLTDVAREIFADNRREYGNGLEKFEPNDLTNSLMLDLAHLSADAAAAVVDLYHRYRTAALGGHPDEAVRLQIDASFRQAFERNDCPN